MPLPDGRWDSQNDVLALTGVGSELTDGKHDVTVVHWSKTFSVRHASKGDSFDVRTDRTTASSTAAPTIRLLRVHAMAVP